MGHTSLDDQSVEANALSDWKVLGDTKEGVIVNGSNTYRYSVEDGQIRVRLPFYVDRDRLQQLLTQEGWAVAPNDEELDSQGWGPDHDEDGYYPCWVWPDREQNATVLAFPPRDYHATVEGDADEAVMDHEPVFGDKALEEFTQWITTLEDAAQSAPQTF